MYRCFAYARNVRAPGKVLEQILRSCAMTGIRERANSMNMQYLKLQ